MLEERRHALALLLQDQSPEVRNTAAQALETLETAAQLDVLLARLQERSRDGRIRAVLALERVASPKIFPPLLELLQDQDPDLRVAVVQVLGRRAHPKTLGAVARLLQDPHPSVRQYAAQAVGHFRDRRLVPHLAILLAGADEPTARAVVGALAEIGAAEGQATLIAALKDGRPAVRAAAAQALARLDIEG